MHYPAKKMVARRERIPRETSRRVVSALLPAVNSYANEKVEPVTIVIAH